MLDSITKLFSKVFGTKSERDLKKITPYLDKINTEYQKLQNISDDELRAKTAYFIDYIEQGLQGIDKQIGDLKESVENDPKLDLAFKDKAFKDIDKLKKDRNEKLEEILMDLLPQAFAVVKETGRRYTENKAITVTASDYDREMAAKYENVTIDGDKATWSNKWLAAGNEVEWNMIHYDVQLLGGIFLHQGKVGEMMTGEGKTLVGTLPAYLNALAKRGVHVVTVNDYLAKRDSEWNAPLFQFHGLSVDCIDKHQPNSESRRKAYRSDITYGTNNEFGFDYLRDNMARDKDDLVQREHHFAMIDEVDSVLIDDARTPLIISGPVPKGDQQEEFAELRPKVQTLVDEQRKQAQKMLNEAKKLIKEGDKTQGGLQLLRVHRSLPKYKPLIKFLGEEGMKQLLQKVEGEYMQDNNRRMPEADEPLLFVIEEKNNSVELTEKGIKTVTGHNSPDFFILPDLATGIGKIENDPEMEDEAKIEAKDALIADFDTKSQRIHLMKQLLKAYTLFEKDVDYILVDNKVKIVDEQTGRVMEGRRYSDGLHQALEAKENVKIEDATQTYATVTLQNYFRMYHKLTGMTGTAITEAGEFWEIYELDVVTVPTHRPIVRADREDFVYKTVREKFNAVAEEVLKLVEQGRPVLVGTTSVENSEIMSRMLKMRGIEHQVLNAKQHGREAEVVAKAGQSGAVTIATNMAGRGTDIKLPVEVKEAGGLAIIGTSRHESRRVDRQLRGRSGRQGDPGSSQFFVSLEDNLMRLFGSDRIASVMDRLGLEEGEVIQHSMITKSIERAQRKVEENNFAIRKRLLEYDDVMNYQREVIYRRRRNALFGDRLQVDIMNSFFDVCVNISETHVGNYEGFKLDALKILGVTTQISEEGFQEHNEEYLTQELYKEALEHYKAKNTSIWEKAKPIFEKVKEERGGVVENIVMPFTDGNRMFQINVNLEKALSSDGDEVSAALGQSATLAVIDHLWKDHLREMDELKQQVQNAVHEQKDPLLIYKFESFELFKSFLAEVNDEIISFLSKARIPVQEQPPMPAAPQQPRRPEPQVTASKAEAGSALGNDPKPQQGEGVPPQAPRGPVEVVKPRHSDKTYQRNDRVTVKYQDGTVKEGVKYKTVEVDVEKGNCVILES
ncbi:preprotein translocase subunit SecA [Flammeovirga yaeyamensis]|uniref:Protein translocase subunit SecA n=1 Tax=Flammeovirga yaeyamensis TaxID=367791 RepID=A0AAX1N893_9BACT|nr:preprotein translocase subunit SecA [Flammeovirga yaeyamensis]MBB3699715.1 preprotein translocase subunit SecA [Flammeovirga yaeyamensis]NMF36715.1 preprotein translocase subunit SecA [Flammeovirga yaeyamensis]QWG02242.1 preprotein translocase subunit SecA [Flammeovirga yaeyamensis]